MKKEKWVIVANKAQARIFKLDNLKLIEETCLLHPESRLHNRDLTSDKPGSAMGFEGFGFVSLDQKKTPKFIEAEDFAKEVADYLQHARSSGKIERLYMAASPGFLGMLRAKLDEATRKLIEHEIDKDISHLTPEEIKSYFPIGV